MTHLPSGTVTFLFTDIEGSTRLWQQFPNAMPAALARHHEILNHAIAASQGYVFQIIGDAFHVAFSSASDAVNAALDAQRALHGASWGETGPIRVRMALHTDYAHVNAESYALGEYLAGEYLALAHTERLLSAGHGGQVLVSAPTAELIREALASQIALRDLGTHRVKDFEPEQIFQVIAPELPVDFPSLKTLDSLPNNLPIQLTSFVGREQEIAELAEMLGIADRPLPTPDKPAGSPPLPLARLLTLTGPGGAGKTRLSLQLAANGVDQFKDGVWFIELAPLSDPTLVPQSVATTLGLHEQPGRPMLDVLKEYVRPKNVLLVLDNCEHLIDACAQLADALLRIAPHLKILASSREPLGIAGETTYPVPPLSVPNRAALDVSKGDKGPETLVQFEAVRLFIDRARAVQPNFSVTNANAAALVEICQRLDGIPLALELAAARVKGLTVEQIARRLDDRFRLLTSGNRAAMPRHQTLQATIEWSYGLVSEPERVLLERLAVFAGGWILEAAEQVGAGEPIESGDVMPLLLHLVDKSLVVADQQGETARYRFLDTIRQFAHDKLELAGAERVALVRNRHLDYFLAFAETIDRTLRGSEQSRGLLLLDHELDNLREAFAWGAKSNNMEAELRLASALSRYWRVRSYFSEGRRWLQDALSRRGSAPASIRAKALMGAGSLANYQADYAHAQPLLEESLTLHRQMQDAQGIALCLNLLSHGRMMTGDFAGAQQALAESISIFRTLGDTRGIGYALYFMGTLHLSTGDLTSARTTLQESLTRLKQVDDSWWVGNTLIQLGWGINRQGEPAQALQLFEEALEISTRFGDMRGTAKAVLYMAEAKCSQGEYAAARTKYKEALKLFAEIGDRWSGTICLEGLGYIAAHQNEPRLAAQLLGAAEHMHEHLGAPIQAVYREGWEWSTNRAREQLDANEFQRAWQAGRALTMEQAIELAAGDSK